MIEQSTAALAPGVARPASPSAAAGPTTSVVVADRAALSRYVPAWEALAANALEPNVFAEHWMLLPALEAFGDSADTRFVLVLVHDPRSGAEPALGAIFPLQRLRRYRGLPFRHFSIWNHLHCFLGTPLVHRGHARACLAAFLDWLGRNGRGERVIEWRDIAADGPFYEALTGVLDGTSRSRFSVQRYTRAVLRPRAGGEAYLEQALPGKSRKEFRRLERRLADTAPLEYAELGAGDDTDYWIRSFLALEASGWRGRLGTALDSTEAGRRFFIRAAAEAARRGRLMMLGLRVGGRFVAMKCNLLAGEGSFAFKIAFDESYARYSPGVLLELENIRRFHGRAELRWMDSCADPDHFMANRLWLDRRELVSMVTAAGGFVDRLFVSSLPALRRLHRAIRRPAAGTRSPGEQETASETER